MARGDEPAYPVRDIDENYKGMTIREAMAMAAMQGLLANDAIDDMTDGQIANDARLFADALLAELEAKP